MRFLLMQVRNFDDPMRPQEVDCFAEALGVDRARIETWDVLGRRPQAGILDEYDVLLFGGSGDYGARGEEPWLLAALDFLRLVFQRGHPTYASCWGFQALGRALGGTLIHDPKRAEIGSHWLCRTPEAANDPLYRRLPERFVAQLGHRDRLVNLPVGAVCLASSEIVPNEAYTFPGKPIYASQFHPELTADRLRQRLETYPFYLDTSNGQTADDILKALLPSTESNQLLRWFVEVVVGR